MLDIILNIGGAMVSKTNRIPTLMEPTCYSRRKKKQENKYMNAIFQDDRKDGK